MRARSGDREPADAGAASVDTTGPASVAAPAWAATLDALPRTEDGARDMLERARWPNGACCPHCGAAAPYRLTPRPGSTTRHDLWKCRACRRQFTVSVGTILESSRLKRTLWLKAIYLLCSSGRPVPVHQLHEMLGIHYDSATSMAQRVRYALEQAARRPLRQAGARGDAPARVTSPAGRAQAACFTLAFRPTLDFAEALASILEVRPEPASWRSTSPARASSASASLAAASPASASRPGTSQLRASRTGAASEAAP